MPRRMYKYRLYPSKNQMKILEEQLELCRLAHNRLLDYCKQGYKENGKHPTQFVLQNLLPTLKRLSPEFTKVYSQVLQNIAKRIKDGYTNFYARRRAGLKAGHPRFKKYGRYKSITYPQMGFEVEERKLRLSKIGDIRIKLHRPIKGVIKTLTLKKMPSGKWYACFSCIVEVKPKEKIFENVGIDVGLHNFAVLSDGTRIGNPRYYRNEERRLKRLSRSFSRKKKGSNNWLKAGKRLAQLCERVKNRRTDFLHKTSRQIADKFETVYVENLQIQNMVKNRYLAKSISDAGWGRFVRMISYKAESAGGRVVKVNPRNTTQRCSQCDEIVSKTLSNRIHDCPHCGLVMDRDLNASRNILKIGRGSPEFRLVEGLTSTSLLEVKQVNPMNQESPLQVGR